VPPCWAAFWASFGRTPAVPGPNLTTRQIVDSPAVELRYSEADEAFRAELRAWLQATLPALAPEPARDAWADRRKWDTDWQRRLFDAGYAGLHWPKEYGGRGASPTEQLIFFEETARSRAPYVGVNFVGTLHAGPTLIEEGTEAQKAAHLPKILRGEEVWCQGFSEPGAGSDLASLRTRAERDGDDYVLNGQKIWCSFGHVADVGEFLVRTDPEAPKHKGISWLILPMDTRGIEVRPLRTVLGSSEFAEVFLTDVRVPVSNRVGAENDGWRVTNVTLKYERGTAFVSELVDSMRLCEEFASMARGRVSDAEIGHCIAEFDALWALTKRNVSQSARGFVGPGAMVIKLAYSEARQRFGELCLEALGQGALHVDDNELVEERLRTLALTIAAGSSQIQRNIIGERVLGLPREPK
jgi:alkylation response protein AidB-like acyl-CoA dehydrogenase